MENILKEIILPAIAFDVLTGIRLALGVAWIVIVPAEFLGITSGLGYTIQDSRENLMYADLAVTILVIGFIGFIMSVFWIQTSELQAKWFVQYIIGNINKPTKTQILSYLIKEQKS